MPSTTEAVEQADADAGQHGLGAATHGAVTVRLSNISKHFASVAALTDVSVDFYAGEVHAILGENGAGKSTLMNVISGVLQPDTGRHRVRRPPGLAALAGIRRVARHRDLVSASGRHR